MPETPDALAGRLETIRRTLASVAADRPTPEQIAEWNTADKEMAQRVRAALPGVPLHHAYAVLQAARTMQRLDEAVAVSSPPPDQTLRDRIAEALAAADGWTWTPDYDKSLSPVWQGYLKRADVVLAVLPPPADRAAVLSQTERDMLRYALDLAQEQLFSRGDEFGEDDQPALDSLRRLAAEAQQQPEFQDRGDAARRAAGIDGTAGDAQDIPHTFVPDEPTGACLLCGLAPSYRKHDAEPKEPHPTEADLAHALAVLDRFHGRDTAAPAVPVQPAADGSSEEAGA